MKLLSIDSSEKVIRLSQTARLLELFQQQRSITNRELNAVCFRYAARIHELRQDGHSIITERMSEGLYRYTYLSAPADESRWPALNSERTAAR